MLYQYSLCNKKTDLKKKKKKTDLKRWSSIHNHTEHTQGHTAGKNSLEKSDWPKDGVLKLDTIKST